MKITVNIEFADAGEAAEALVRLRSVKAAPAVITPEDNPAAGFPPDAPETPAAPTGLAAVGFGQGVTLPPGATPALSSAAVAPPPTAPAAPGLTTVGAAQMLAAPIAPAAAAPAGPAALTPPAPNAGVELDSAGLPWDGRIHASTKTKNKTDGTWRAKRDLDLALKAGVEAELRQVLALNASAAPVAAPVAPPAAPVAAPAAPPAMIPSAPGTPSAVAPVATFGDLMERLTPLMMAGKVTTDQVSQVLAAHGLSGIGQLALAPNLVPVVAAQLLGASA